MTKTKIHEFEHTRSARTHTTHAARSARKEQKIPPMSSSSSRPIVLKVSWKGDLRRVSVASTLPFEAVLALVLERFQECVFGRSAAACSLLSRFRVARRRRDACERSLDGDEAHRRIDCVVCECGARRERVLWRVPRAASLADALRSAHSRRMRSHRLRLRVRCGQQKQRCADANVRR